MDHFEEQFRQELAYQEKKSNKYTLRGFALFIFAVSLIWFLTIIDLFTISKSDITIVLIINIVLFILAMVIGRKRDLAEPWIKYVFLSLICIGSAVIAAFLTFHAPLVFVIPLLFAIQYRRKNVIWFAYFVTILTMLISCLYGFFYGLCDLNLLFESQYVRAVYLEMLETGAWSLPTNANPIFIILLFEVFPQCIILFVFAVIIQYTVLSSNEDAHRISQLTYLKEMDMGTRAFNKNKYEEMVTEYYPKVKQIAVLFWDLNHLKKINDRFGHSAGDRAIQSLAAALIVHADQHCRVFRVGGDEFLVIIDEPDQGEPEQLILSVRQQLADENAQLLEDDMPISSAVGYASGSGKNILEIVQKADTNMYVDKKKIEES